MRLHIVLSTSELIEELEYEALENKRKAMAEAHKSNPNHKSDSSGPSEPKLSNKTTIKPDTRTNTKLAELAGVFKSTVTRAKKSKIETPDGYNKEVRVVKCYM